MNINFVSQECYHVDYNLGSILTTTNPNFEWEVYVEC